MSAECIRQETLASQGVRSDLFKWKLLLVAGLGSAGLGLGSVKGGAAAGNDSGLELLLCLIPFICLYVDLLSYHLNLRMIVIGRFFLHYAPADSDRMLQNFEAFASRMAAIPGAGPATGADGSDHTSVYQLEDWALTASTAFLAFLVLIYGIFFAIMRHQTICLAEANLLLLYRAKVTLFLGSGLAGLIGSWRIKKRYLLLSKLIESVAAHFCWGKGPAAP